MLSMVNGFLPAANVWAVASLIDAVNAYATAESPGAGPAVLHAGALFGAALLLTFSGTRLASVLEAEVRIRAGVAIKGSYLAKSASVDIDRFESPEALDAMHRAGTEGADRVVRLIVTALTVLASVATLCSIGLILITWDPAIAALLIVAPFPSFIASVRMARRQYSVDVDRTGKKRMARYLEGLLLRTSTIREVRHFAVSPRFLAQHTSIISAIARQDRSYVQRTAAVDGAWGLFGLGLYLSAVWRATSTALTHGAVGQLTGCLQAIGSLQDAAGQVVRGVTMMHEDLLYSSNLVAYLDSTPAPRPEGARALTAAGPIGVELRRVRYTYPSRQEATLLDVDLAIPAGSMVAIVGQSGSGKTTLARVIARLCVPESGQYLVNGVSADAYSLESVRARIAILFQDPLRYQMSLRDNVTLGDVARVGADEEVEELLSQVRVSPRELGCDSLDTTLGKEFENGVEPSVGQWQRIATARALFRRSGLLLLDEPTSAQDPVHARELVQLLVRMRDCTRIVVTHDPVVARAADHRVLVCQGRVHAVERDDPVLHDLLREA
ncbi:ATP-binding cassette domain-containing protein [Cellulosimicrobium cellulans]|uniref:ATP-binding cassette domain-containing protein n=1 Tax=Cellulosimicrobium cellulans TaxID=1710 RepID=UPI0021CB58AA|nr:ABC transporter ATP-binding protein [Cellulosimicrobium cellulans]